MGHHITAIVIPGAPVPAALETYDLRPVALAEGLTLLHIDHYYSAYWQARLGLAGELPIVGEVPLVFPREAVLAVIAAAVTGLSAPRFVILQTDYFGGVGSQWAFAYEGADLLPGDGMINAALRQLGVRRRAGVDEFDTVGLGGHRSPPEDLERYVDLCDELGV